MYTCLRGCPCLAEDEVLHGQEVDETIRIRHGLRMDSAWTPCGFLVDSDLFLRIPNLLDGLGAEGPRLDGERGHTRSPHELPSRTPDDFHPTNCLLAPPMWLELPPPNYIVI